MRILPPPTHPLLHALRRITTIMPPPTLLIRTRTLLHPVDPANPDNTSTARTPLITAALPLLKRLLRSTPRGYQSTLVPGRASLVALRHRTRLVDRTRAHKHTRPQIKHFLFLSCFLFLQEPPVLVYFAGLQDCQMYDHNCLCCCQPISYRFRYLFPLYRFPLLIILLAHLTFLLYVLNDGVSVPFSMT